MAEAATVPQFDQVQELRLVATDCSLYAVPDLTEQVPVPFQTLISADTVPELAFTRRRVEINATKILKQNRDLWDNGDVELVPTPIDALGTARQVVQAKQEFGEGSPQQQEMFTGLVQDMERLTGEAATKNDPEYFARAPQQFQPTTEEYFSHGLSISTMTKNGLSPLADSEDQQRRIKENVEEDGTLVPIGRMIARLGLKGMVELLPIPIEPELPEVSVHVTTISQCADYAIRDYALNPKASHGGFRPAMEGLVIRRVHFEDDSADREEEQAIIAGKYITHSFLQTFLTKKGVIAADQQLTKTEMLGTQLISVNDGSAMEFVEELDTEAGKFHGINLFMGELVSEDHPKDYAAFIEGAKERKKRLAPLPEQLAVKVINLVEAGVDSQVAEGLLNSFLKTELLDRARDNPELAEAMFDKATAEGFAEVARLQAAGHAKAAHSLQLAVERNAPEPSYCGAGSCGLEIAASSEAAKAQQLGLKGDVIHDTERPCPSCSAMKVHYDSAGSKACTGCGNSQIKAA